MSQSLIRNGTKERGEIASALEILNHLRPADAVQGREIYSYFGARVIEHTTSKGDVLAIKVRKTINRSEGEMMHYAATHGVVAPKVRGFYEVIGTKRLAQAMVSERVPGEPLANIWQELSSTDQLSIKTQLRVQLANMHTCKQPFIGRVDRQPTRNIHDGLGNSFCGPFPDEKAFDNWCLKRIPGGPLARFRWKRLLEKERQHKPAASFVPTHGDLTPRNIIVQGNKITGIIDWERSGFFPEYAEYAFAMILCDSHEEWWIPVLEELLSPCSEHRLKLTSLVEEGIAVYYL